MKTKKINKYKFEGKKFDFNTMKYKNAILEYKHLNEQEKRIYNSVVETLSFHLKRAEIKRVVEVLNLYAGTKPKPNNYSADCCI